MGEPEHISSILKRILNRLEKTLTNDNAHRSMSAPNHKEMQIEAESKADNSAIAE